MRSAASETPSELVPMRLPVPDSKNTPIRPLPSAVLPSALVPIRLPAITLLLAVGSVIQTRSGSRPCCPEMTLPSAASLMPSPSVPMMLLLAAKNDHAIAALTGQREPGVAGQVRAQVIALNDVAAAAT